MGALSAAVAANEHPPEIAHRRRGLPGRRRRFRGAVWRRLRKPMDLSARIGAGKREHRAIAATKAPRPGRRQGSRRDWAEINHILGE